MSKFKVGDLVEIIAPESVWNGLRATVVEEPRPMLGTDESGTCAISVAYLIQLQTGAKLGAGEWQLRKIEPPSDSRQLGSWDNLPWLDEIRRGVNA